MTEERFWLKNYPQGIPAEINTQAYESLGELMQDCVHRNKDATAYLHLGRRMSFAELDRLSQRFSSILQDRFHVQKGERVGLMLPNILAHPVCMFGILRAGATVVNLNPLYTPRELGHILADSGATTIIVMDRFAATLEAVTDNTAIKNICKVTLGDLHGPVRRWLLNTFARLASPYRPATRLECLEFSTAMQQQTEMLPDAGVSREDIAYLQYTSGTTGQAKGAMLTHGNIIANNQQAYAWISPAFHVRNPHVITALPLYHIFALQANCFVVLRLGGCSHLITNPRDMKRFMRELRGVTFHAITGVNTLFRGMMQHPLFRQLDFSQLQLSLAGGMAVQKNVAEEWYLLTGSPIVEAYGLTEASPAICANPVNATHSTGSIGLPLPSTEVSIRDENGNALAIGETGELWARGPQVMKGYWKNPGASQETITQDGWLKTGDLAYMDDAGCVHIADRKNDMIIISGFNVYPNEVEDVLTMHEDILEAGVIGVLDDDGDELVKAVIVRKDNRLSGQDVIEYCRRNLAAYKVPKIIEFRETLPKNNVGKILRRELR